MKGLQLLRYICTIMTKACRLIQPSAESPHDINTSGIKTEGILDVYLLGLGV